MSILRILKIFGVRALYSYIVALLPLNFKCLFQFLLKHIFKNTIIQLNPRMKVPDS